MCWRRAALPVGRPAVSKHLRVLSEVGLVRCRVDGRRLGGDDPAHHQRGRPAQKGQRALRVAEVRVAATRAQHREPGGQLGGERADVQCTGTVLDVDGGALEAPERLTLQQASVIGPVFWDRALLALEAKATVRYECTKFCEPVDRALYGSLADAFAARKGKPGINHPTTPNARCEARWPTGST